MEQARDSGKLTKTKQDIKYCVGLWEAWVRAPVLDDKIYIRGKFLSVFLSLFLSFNIFSFSFLLSFFLSLF